MKSEMNLELQPIDQPVFTPPFPHGRAVLSFAWPLRGANGAMASPKEETSWGDAKGLALEAMPSCKEYQFVHFGAGKITSQGNPPWFFLWGFHPLAGIPPNWCQVGPGRWPTTPKMSAEV